MRDIEEKEEPASPNKETAPPNKEIADAQPEGRPPAHTAAGRGRAGHSSEEKGKGGRRRGKLHQ